jgi:flagellar protein FlgJ
VGIPSSTISNADNVLDANGLSSLKRAVTSHDASANQKVAKQFEGMFLSMMLKGMRDTLPQDGPMSSDATRMATSMSDDQLAQNLSKGKGIGLADALVKQLSRINSPVTPGTGTTPMSLKVQNQAAMPLRAIEAAGLAYHRAAVHSYGYNAASYGATSSYGNARSSPASSATAPATDVTQTHVDFVTKCSDAAKAASDATGLSAKAILGQAALESGWGKHEIKDAHGQSSFNLFGIKADPSWTGKTVTAMTTEFVGGVAQRVAQKFRAYASYADSFTDYAKTIQNNPRYQAVMQAGHDALAFAKAMGHSGYATDPNYGQKLAQVINGPISQLTSQITDQIS